jgi:hypothetical protein
MLATIRNRSGPVRTTAKTHHQEHVMKLSTSLLTVTLVVTGASSLVLASPPHTGALALPANRIVGLWSTEGLVGPCNGTPVNPVRNTLLFQAGGTVVENARISPAGVPGAFGVAGINQRGQALGTWSYDPATDAYSMHLRFDWYVDGAYHGYMIVDRELRLSEGNRVLSGPVWADRYSTTGDLIAAVCGAAVSTRL